MAADPCATTRGGRRNAFTVGNGHHLRATSGTWEWTGRPVYRTGVWLWRAARSAGEAGQLAASVRRGPSKAPSISYMEGVLLHSARQRGFCRDDTLVNLAMPGGRDHLAPLHPSLRADRHVFPPPWPTLNRGGRAESYTARLVSVRAR